MSIVNTKTSLAKLSSAVLLTVAMLSGSSTAVLAQSSTTMPVAGDGFRAMPQVNCAERPVKRFRGQQNYMYQTMALKAPVSLPNLPAYRGQGASYQSGVYYPKLKARQCYLMRYLAKETPAEIMKMYKNSLMQNGWQINEHQTNGKQLTAAKKDSGAYITLCACPSSKPDFKSSFEIKFLSTGSVQN